MNFGSPNSYTLPIILAIIVHALGGLLLFSQWPDFDKTKLPPVPKFITASVVQEQNQVVKKQQEKKRKQIIREKKRKKEAQQRKRKQVAEKKREQQKKLAEAKKRAEQKKLAKKRKQVEQKRLAEEQRKKQAWEQKLLEKKAIEEAERKLQQEIADAMEAERKKLEDAKQAERRASITNDFSSQIKQHVTDMWNYPRSITNPNLEVKVRVNLLPTGQVMGVEIIRSSGQTVLDESVEKAIYSASPLPVPQDSVVFEREFRRFNMIFRPEDAVL